MFKDNEIEIRSADSVIEIIRSEIKEQTKCFEFFLVEKFDEFELIADKDRDELQITGITCVHSLVTQDDKLYIEDLSCIKCTVNSV